MKTNIPPTFKPAITGPWQLLFRPHETGCYINDHTLLRAHDENWHLFGITRDQSQVNPDHERYFAHGVGRALISDAGFEEKEAACDFGLRSWAPALVRAHTTGTTCSTGRTAAVWPSRMSSTNGAKRR